MPTPGIDSGEVNILYNDLPNSKTIKAMPKNPIKMIKEDILRIKF